MRVPGMLDWRPSERRHVELVKVAALTQIEAWVGGILVTLDTAYQCLGTRETTLTPTAARVGWVLVAARTERAGLDLS
jgi:GTP1/Obg family GTP-binding protein